MAKFIMINIQFLFIRNKIIVKVIKLLNNNNFI